MIPFRAKKTAVPTPGIKLSGNVIKYLTRPSALKRLTGFNNSLPRVTTPLPPRPERLIARPFETRSEWPRWIRIASKMREFNLGETSERRRSEMIKYDSARTTGTAIPKAEGPTNPTSEPM